MPSDPVEINGYEVWIHSDGAEKGMSLGGGPWRKVVYRVAGADSDGFIDSLFGAGQATQVITFGSPWSPPSPHRYPGNENIVALEASAVPVNLRPDPLKLVGSQWDVVSVTYGVPQFDVFGQQAEMAFGGQPEPWCRDEIRGYMQSYPIEMAALVMKGPDGEVTGETPARNFEIQVPHLELRRTRMFVPYLYLPVLTSLVGKVNYEPFWGFGIGTLRFEPFDTVIESDTAGRRVTTLVTSMTWRPYDWNMTPKPDGPGWEYVGYADASDAPYQYADFSLAYGVWRS
jgi:hypothetical protein